MLTPVTATCFHRPMGVGKTAPSLVTCVQADASKVELVVKFAGGCEAGIGSLVGEAVTNYQSALPAEWIGDGDDIGRILEYVRSLKQNMDLAILNLSEALQ